MRKIYTKITYFEVNPDAALHRKLTVHLENKSGNWTLSVTKVCSSEAVGPHRAELVQQIKLLWLIITVTFSNLNFSDFQIPDSQCSSQKKVFRYIQQNTVSSVLYKSEYTRTDLYMLRAKKP